MYFSTEYTECYWDINDAMVRTYELVFQRRKILVNRPIFEEADRFLLCIL